MQRVWLLVHSDPTTFSQRGEEPLHAVLLNKENAEISSFDLKHRPSLDHHNDNKGLQMVQLTSSGDYSSFNL